MHAQSQKGLSLVELMVAMTIALVLLAGVLSIFMSSKSTYLTNEKTARLQENGRLALDLMVHDIRSAGYSGCARASTFSTTLNNSADVLWNYELPVQGFESLGGGNYAPALGVALVPAPVGDSDVIVVRKPVRDRPAMNVQADLASATDNPQVLAASGPVAAGQIMLITDCQASTVFQASGWGAGAPNASVLHAAGGANPGNATADLGFQYQAGSRLLPLETVIYWVGDDGTGPALYRRIGNSPEGEMLVEGVQALQFAYGEDVDVDRVANDYFSADDIGDWNDIISVNLALLVRSEEVGLDLDTSTYQLLEPALGGMTLGPFDDRRQRMLFTTTAAVRNRAL
jgi:type IV pilus assembly protein PilW